MSMNEHPSTNKYQQVWFSFQLLMISISVAVMLMEETFLKTSRMILNAFQTGVEMLLEENSGTPTSFGDGPGNACLSTNAFLSHFVFTTQ